HRSESPLFQSPTVRPVAKKKPPIPRTLPTDYQHNSGPHYHAIVPAFQCLPVCKAAHLPSNKLPALCSRLWFHQVTQKPLYASPFYRRVPHGFLFHRPANTPIIYAWLRGGYQYQGRDQTSRAPLPSRPRLQTNAWEYSRVFPRR